MFNDQVMALLIVMAAYYLLKNNPIVGASMLSLGLSIKAGALLMLPALFGSIQLNWGIRTLLISFITFFAIQTLVALPFILGETTVRGYISRARLDGSGRKGANFHLEEMDWLSCYFSESSFWQWVPVWFYDSKHGVALVFRIVFLIGNIYHFFIKKGAFWPCIKNLTSPDKPKILEIKLTTQILVIGFMLGACVLPGCPIQFEFWYSFFIPLLADFIFPAWLSVFVYPELCHMRGERIIAFGNC